MRTSNIRVAFLLAFFVGAQFALTGCQKRCQQMATQAFTNLSQTEWRVVKTNNPNMKGLDNYSFITLKFNIDFTGELYNVSENRKSELPDKIFRWKADPAKRALAAAYTDPTEESEEGTETQAGGEAVLVNYRYSLGKELNLTETKTGYTYRLVPFSEEFGGGIIQPDQACTF
jgi:hypothetical protein